MNYKLRNRMRLGFWLGWLEVQLAKLSSKFGSVAVHSVLSAKVFDENGKEIEDLGVLGYRKVTDNGVAFIVDAWQNSVELENMKYHGVGTGTNAEAASDSALQTESTTALNPDSTRATGTQSEAAANILQSVGVVAFDATAAITEHGLFSQAATGGGVLFDRTVFSAINVLSGYSISFTYQVTFTSGG